MYFSKSSTATRIYALYILYVLLFASCVREGTEECVQYALNIRAVDAEGNDLTETGAIEKSEVYLFNEKGYVRMIPASISSDYLFGEDKDSKLTLVAWGNLKEDTLITRELMKGTSIEEAKIQLRKHAEGTHIPVTDLFYSRKELGGTQTRSRQEETLTLVMERIAAGVTIRTHNFAKRYSTAKRPCYFIVRGTGTEMDFSGKTVGEGAGYKPASATDVLGDIYTPPFHIFPMREGGRIEIDIYREQDKVCTVLEDNNLNPLQVIAGKQTNIEIDFRHATVETCVTVTPWGEMWQDTEM